MENLFFATTSGTIYHVGVGTITRVAKNDQSNVPHDIHAEPFVWNYEPKIGKRADYRLTRTGGYVTTTMVTHIWPAPVGYTMLPDVPTTDPNVTPAVLRDSLVDLFA